MQAKLERDQNYLNKKKKFIETLVLHSPTTLLGTHVHLQINTVI